MKIQFQPLIKPAAAAFVASCAVACTSMGAQKQPMLTSAQLAEQHVAAIGKQRAQEADYLNGLATAVKQEKRNDAWAAQKESELRASYAAEKGIPPGALKSVECRSSKCELQLQSAEPSPTTVADQYIAINQWIAAKQPCGYTITTPEGSAQAPAVTRIFLDCSK